MTLGVAFVPVLEAVRQGEAWAWERLYTDLSGVLLGYLRGHGVADPEGILGDVWLRVARDIAGFSGNEAQFRSWIFTIAHHRSVDAYRAAARRPTSRLAPSTIRTLPSDDDPEQRALDRISSTEAMALLSVLTTDQREVVLLRIFGDLSIAEVAKLTGRPEGPVKALQHRAFAALRRSCQEISHRPVSPDPPAAVTRSR